MKHVDIAKAWFAGKTVQVRPFLSVEWSTLPRVEDVNVCPQFNDQHEYRIKTEPTHVWVSYWNDSRVIVTKVEDIAQAWIRDSRCQVKKVEFD